MEKPKLSEEIPFPQETLDWFEAWRKSPRTDGWDELQWQYLIDTALVHSAVWGSQDFSMLGELRTRLAYMGLSFDKENVVHHKKNNITPLEVIQNRRNKKAGASA